MFLFLTWVWIQVCIVHWSLPTTFAWYFVRLPYPIHTLHNKFWIVGFSFFLILFLMMYHRRIRHWIQQFMWVQVVQAAAGVVPLPQHKTWHRDRRLPRNGQHLSQWHRVGLHVCRWLAHLPWRAERWGPHVFPGVHADDREVSSAISLAVCVCVCVCRGVCVVWVWVFVWLHDFEYVCVSVCTRAWLCVCLCVCVCVCVCAFISCVCEQTWMYWL